MKQVKPFLSALFLLSIMGVSCKKDKSLSRSELLVGTWRLSAAGLDNNMNGTLETAEHITIPAGTDIIETFNTDHTGRTVTIISGNATMSNFTWQLKNNDQQLTTTTTGTGSSVVTNVQISQLTSNQLMGYDVTANPRTIIVLSK